jgi:hypothetical protein
MPIHHPPEDIDLEPHAWYVATWRNLPALPKGTPEPFDQRACFERLRTEVTRSSSGWDLHNFTIPHWLSPEEALFWLRVFVHLRDAINIKQLKKAIDEDKIEPRELVMRMPTSWSVALIAFQRITAALFDAKTSMEALVEFDQAYGAGSRYWVAPCLLESFRRDIRPYLSDAEREEIRAVLRPMIEDALQHGRPCSLLFCGILASVGTPDLTKQILQSTEWFDIYHFSEIVMLSFDCVTREEVLPLPSKHIALVSRFRSPLFLAGMIATLEEDAWQLLKLVIPQFSREDSARVASYLGRIHRPSAAPILLRLSKSGHRLSEIQEWLETHLDLAIEGLLPLVGDDELGDAVDEFLKKQIRAQKIPLIEKKLAKLPASRAQAIRQRLESTRLTQIAQTTEVPVWFGPVLESDALELPDWVDLQKLPDIWGDDGPLPRKCLPTIVDAFARVKESPQPSLLARLKRHCDSRSLESFAWALFSACDQSQGKNLGQWMIPLGIFGQDAVCLRLEELTNTWAQRSRYMFSSQALKCLQEINSEQALGCLYRLSNPEIGSWANGATPALHQLMDKRNVTEEQIDDSIVPRLGLPENAQLDLGERTFTLHLSSELAPCLLDQRYEIHAEFPTLQPTDQPLKFELARTQWEHFRKRVLEILPQQRERLQRAMKTARMWESDFFAQMVSRHPLLGPLVSSLILATTDEHEKARLTFRPIPGGFVDLAGSPVTLPRNTKLIIAHPAMIPYDESLLWRDVLEDNKLVQPFAQLQSAAHRPTKAEGPMQELLRYSGRSVLGSALVSGLDREGWSYRRSPMMYAFKFFETPRQFAVIELSPTFDQQDVLRTPTTLTLGRCWISQLDAKKKPVIPSSRGRLNMNEAHPMVFHELVQIIEEGLNQ